MKGTFVETNKGLMIECGDRMYMPSEEMKKLELDLMTYSDRLLNECLKYNISQAEKFFIDREIRRRRDLNIKVDDKLIEINFNRR